MIKKMIKRSNWVVGVIVALLIAVGSWATFGLVKIGMFSALSRFGVVEEWKVLSIIIVLVFIVLLTIGYSLRKVVKKMV